MTVKILLWINISLFMLHEMDALKTEEWKMMIFIKDLDSIRGSKVFIALHFPLYFFLFYTMNYYTDYLFPALSVLLIVHQFAHILFRKHSENRMNNLFSQTIILLMSVISSISLVYYFANIK